MKFAIRPSACWLTQAAGTSAAPCQDSRRARQPSRQAAVSGTVASRTLIMVLTLWPGPDWVQLQHPGGLTGTNVLIRARNAVKVTGCRDAEAEIMSVWERPDTVTPIQMSSLT